MKWGLFVIFLPTFVFADIVALPLEQNLKARGYKRTFRCEDVDGDKWYMATLWQNPGLPYSKLVITSTDDIEGVRRVVSYESAQIILDRPEMPLKLKQMKQVGQLMFSVRASQTFFKVYITITQKVCLFYQGPAELMKSRKGRMYMEGIEDRPGQSSL